MKALLVLDMLNDFMTGKIANPRAERIVPPIQQLLGQARADRDDWLVVYANDAHLPSDFELRVWGEHAMAGTPGAQIIAELAAQTESSSFPSVSTPGSTRPGSTRCCASFGVDTAIVRNGCQDPPRVPCILIRPAGGTLSR